MQVLKWHWKTTLIFLIACLKPTSLCLMSYSSLTGYKTVSRILILTLTYPLCYPEIVLLMCMIVREYLLIGSVCALFRNLEEEILDPVKQHVGVSVLLSVAASWQSPGAAAAEAASTSTSAERPAQEGQGQTTQPGAEISAAPLPKLLLSTGEKSKHYNPACWDVYCIVLHCSILSLQKTTWGFCWIVSSAIVVNLGDVSTSRVVQWF